MSNKKVQITICRYDDMLQIPTIGRAIAIRIWEMRRVRTITPELLATIPYIKMEVVNQYIDYTSLNEFEFEEQDNELEDQDELDYEEQDDLVDFDDIMTQASESDKVRAQHDISQHQSWLESPFDKLKISDQKGRMPVVMFISISKYETRGNRCTAKRSDSDKTGPNQHETSSYINRTYWSPT